MKYFLHDTNALDDEKVTELFMNFGYEGVGLFYCILEKIAKQEKPVKTLVLKRQLSVGKKLDKCWLFMESIELISSTNGETFNKQLMNYSENYKIKKEKTAKRVSEWRDKQSLIENVTCYERVRNATKVKESKVKESKDIYSDFIFFNNGFEVVWKNFKDMRVKIKKPLTIEAERLNLLDLSKISKDNKEEAIKIVNQSIQKCWQGFFPLKSPDIFNQKLEKESKLSKATKGTENYLELKYGKANNQ